MNHPLISRLFVALRKSATEIVIIAAFALLGACLVQPASAATWTVNTSPVTNTLRGIWGTSSSNVWVAVGGTNGGRA